MSEKEIDKIYKFYYKGDITKTSILHPSDMLEDGWEELDKYDNPKIKGKYPLYAFTIIKKYAKEFKKQRDKDRFIMISSNVSQDEIDYLFENYPDLVLNRYAYATKEIIDSYLSQKEVEIISTRFEYLSCTDDHDMFLMSDTDYWFNSLPYECYNDKIKEALKILQYPQLRKLYTNTIYETNNEYDYPDVTIDELSLFIYNFQETLM